MSRGPGKTQMKILEALKVYRDIGTGLQWEFNPGSSWMAIHADEFHIEQYTRGEIVPLWIIRRDTGIDKTAISRAIKGLGRMGYITRRGADLDTVENSFLRLCENTKHISLTTKGLGLVESKMSKI